MTRIAVLGLGAMGARMARRLLDAGHALIVYNRSPERAEPLIAAGATAAPTPKAAAEAAEVVLTMLTDDEAARQVWLDEATGLLGGLRPQTVALECSTVTPSWIQDLGAALARREVALLDAPVAGSRPQAEAGQLVFLVGGPSAALEQVRPLLALMGGAIHHAGPLGSGAWMKLAVNALFGIQVAAVSELLGMLQRAGVAPDRALEVLGQVPVTSPAMKGVGGLIAANKHDPLFPIDLVEKDFRYALAAGESVGGRLPTTRAVRELFARAQQEGLGGANISGLAQLFVD